jgi:2-oxoglutarate ferredoxin oxidoreductase subunit alpha
MILGDGLIGQMMEPVEFPEGLRSEQVNPDAWATSGMDTRKSETPNLVKSLFLDPEKLNTHNLLLKAKYDRMKQEDVLYDVYNLDSDYKILIISYGTMSRVCRTVIDIMKEDGIEVGMVRPQTLFPFPETAIHDAAVKESCRTVISIEMSMGQMVEDVERVVRGKRPVKWYGKCGGDVPTPEEVIEVLNSL